MMGREMFAILLLGLVAVGLVASAPQLDPVVNFCRRNDHRSVVADGTLYIDGGSATFINITSSGKQSGNITDGENQYLITVDMSVSWDWNKDITVKALTKTNAVSTGNKTPNLVRGAMFRGPPNDTKIYAFGGSTTYENVNFPGWVGPTPDQYPLYSYDYAADKWNAIDLSSSQVIRPSSGANAEAPDQGLGFWYNGQLDSGSSTESAPLGDGVIKFMMGMIVIDLHTGTAKNVSTSMVSDQPRVRGRMVYVPGIGKKGVLVLIGGGEKPFAYTNADWHGTLVSMDQVHIFDIASLDDPSTPNGTWYKQATSGNTPKPRLDHCLVVVSSQDGSSHNIYMYGGRDGASGYFDDAFVLSLPSFTWINIYTGIAPRYGMTCHLVANRQMITVGGGSAAAINRDCDWETKSVAIYDLSTLEWGSKFTHDAAPYELPPRITDVIGGQKTGNATMKQPVGGFNGGLGSLFSLGQAPNETTSEHPPSKTDPAPGGPGTGTPPGGSGSGKGAVVGGVVGGIAGVALIALGAFLFRRRRNKQKLAAGALYEVDGQHVVEKEGSAPMPSGELLADTQYFPPAELPGGVSTYQPHELNPANYTREMK